jgi:hypothetical protein
MRSLKYAIESVDEGASDIVCEVAAASEITGKVAVEIDVVAGEVASKITGDDEVAIELELKIAVKT